MSTSSPKSVELATKASLLKIEAVVGEANA